MPISEQSAISKIEAELMAAGFSLGNAPKPSNLSALLLIIFYLK
ncbi:hypothetical protein ABSA28_01184 [Candidatus Hepatincolaceae symbiont of Richtersius coronifer]